MQDASWHQWTTAKLAKPLEVGITYLLLYLGRYLGKRDCVSTLGTYLEVLIGS